ncbi:hypothetical protein GFB49_14355 [Epibacterium sp. SM1979]|uniref:Uncharacterized protein n=1 Tax=Tritonibacter litoralis TaxID=2662264 RepID=A0A843YJ09_9RHOB|nr:hypothetical protein [Tritonibacter litoralis]MQQ09645.1 hypothetical protein [Tritonibacter litoralis]
MSFDSTFKLSGVMLGLSGLSYVLDTVLDAALPQASPGLGALVPIFGLIGFPGFWESLRDTRFISVLAYVSGMLGLAGLVAITFLGNRVFPELAPQKVGEIVSVVKLEFLLISIVFLISALLLVVLCWRADWLKRTGALFYAAGAVPVSLTPFVSPVLVSAGGVAIGLGLGFWGLGLISPQNKRINDD